MAGASRKCISDAWGVIQIRPDGGFRVRSLQQVLVVGWLGTGDSARGASAGAQGREIVTPEAAT